MTGSIERGMRACVWPNQTVGDECNALPQEIAACVHERAIVIPIGYPNFYFALVENLEWTPRMDGFLLVKEMELN